MIGGFEEPSAGAIYLGERDVVGLPPYKRDVNTVFQNYALFPHLSILENVAFGMRRQGRKGKQLAGRVREILELVDLQDLESAQAAAALRRPATARRPCARARQQASRAPAGRAVGALDLKLRRQMQLELKAIQHDVGITFIHVTHDQEEAMTMADTIAVMNGGRVEQLGPPNDLYERPQTAFVAGFLGVSNLLPGNAAGPDDDQPRRRAPRSRSRPARCRAAPAASPSASARRRSGSATARRTRSPGRSSSPRTSASRPSTSSTRRPDDSPSTCRTWKPGTAEGLARRSDHR